MWHGIHHEVRIQCYGNTWGKQLKKPIITMPTKKQKPSSLNVKLSTPPSEVKRKMRPSVWEDFNISKAGSHHFAGLHPPIASHKGHIHPFKHHWWLWFCPNSFHPWCCRPQGDLLGTIFKNRNKKSQKIYYKNSVSATFTST